MIFERIIFAPPSKKRLIVLMCFAWIPVIGLIPIALMIRDIRVIDERLARRRN